MNADGLGGGTLSEGSAGGPAVLMRVVGLDKSYGGLKAVEAVTFDRCPSR